MTEPAHDVPLAPLTTLHLGGPARTLVIASTDTELVQAVRDADAAGESVLLLAGGSNLVISDDGFAGTVVHVATAGIAAEDRGESVLLTVAAGEPWDAVVQRCVTDGLVGVECLSGIPGSTGATPIQNVGAYGQEVSQTITSVRVWDRTAGEITELPAAACGFGYRTSAFKGAERHVVLSVTFALARGTDSAPVTYAELAKRLHLQVGGQAPLTAVREAVLALRSAKGMVLDPADPDTVSAGSFFTNPILDAEQWTELERRTAEKLGSDVEPPRFPAPEGLRKTSAAWLIEQAGFSKGYSRGHVSVSSKHTLALINQGDASTEDLIGLAREIRDTVERGFGVTLVTEPTLVGVAL